MRKILIILCGAYLVCICSCGDDEGGDSDCDGKRCTSVSDCCSAAPHCVLSTGSHIVISTCTSDADRCIEEGELCSKSEQCCEYPNATCKEPSDAWGLAEKKCTVINSCGDGRCSGNETCESCPGDCCSEPCQVDSVCRAWCDCEESEGALTGTYTYEWCINNCTDGMNDCLKTQSCASCTEVWTNSKC